MIGSCGRSNLAERIITFHAFQRFEYSRPIPYWKGVYIMRVGLVRARPALSVVIEMSMKI